MAHLTYRAAVPNFFAYVQIEIERCVKRRFKTSIHPSWESACRGGVSGEGAEIGGRGPMET